MLGPIGHVRAKSNKNPLKWESYKARFPFLNDRFGCRENALVGKGSIIFIGPTQRSLWQPPKGVMAGWPRIVMDGEKACRDFEVKSGRLGEK